MSAPSFTPGPWSACCLDRDPHYVFGPNGDESICAMLGNDPASDNFELASGEITIEQKRANARLIAAAPELLEALQNLISTEKYGTGGMGFKVAMALAEEAITKATGRATA